VNPTIVRLTARAMLGGRRMILLAALAVLLVALAVLLRLVADVNESEAATLLRGVSLGTLLPLFGLIVGTGAIGPEIDDGSIVYVLAKPVPRATIIHSKLAVAVLTMLVFAAFPTFLAGVIMAGGSAGIALGFGVGAFVAGAVYSAIFLLLATAMRHAVVLGQDAVDAALGRGQRAVVIARRVELPDAQERGIEGHRRSLSGTQDS
jgi:ABC-2 type transport system permease protein